MGTAVVGGVFALVGALGGVLLSNLTGKWSHERSIQDEDERRWQNDRRVAYAAYLALVGSMMREIDGLGTRLGDSAGTFPGDSAEGEQISDSDEELIREGLTDYFANWEEELQPALGEVQLLASPEVADIADRVADALMEITSPVQLRTTYTEYFAGWRRATDLIVVMRNAMRVELGLPPAAPDAYPARRDPNWPWLSGETASDPAP